MNNANLIKKFITNIYFWIILFFLIRLIGITNPPIEPSQNWRQTTVAMVARNYYEIDYNFFYPRIDFAGDKTGITGMECPILNYSIYLLAKILGYQHWYGRLINLIISSLGILFFYKLTSKYFTQKHAFISTVILLSSIWFAFSRKIMPDTFAMSFIIAGIYFGSNYLDRNIRKYSYLELLLYSICIAIGSLSKLPSAYLLIVFLIFLFQKAIPFKRKIVFATISVVSLIPTTIWYFYWVPYLVDTFGFWHFFMGKSFSEGIREIVHNTHSTLANFYQNALQYIGFIAFIYGIGISIYQKNMKLLIIFALSLGSFMIIIFKSGFTFAHHAYYVIPFVPVMALVAGYGLSVLKGKFTYVILLVISIECIANQYHDFKVPEKEKSLLSLEKDLDKISNKKDLILINSNNVPTAMYFAHRKGWIDFNYNITNAEYISSLKNKGLKYIIILKKIKQPVILNYPIVLDNEEYCIYKI